MSLICHLRRTVGARDRPEVRLVDTGGGVWCALRGQRWPGLGTGPGARRLAAAVSDPEIERPSRRSDQVRAVRSLGGADRDPRGGRRLDRGRAGRRARTRAAAPAAAAARHEQHRAEDGSHTGCAQMRCFSKHHHLAPISGVSPDPYRPGQPQRPRRRHKPSRSATWAQRQGRVTRLPLQRLCARVRRPRRPPGDLPPGSPAQQPGFARRSPQRERLGIRGRRLRRSEGVILDEPVEHVTLTDLGQREVLARVVR
jgi:hypothetical protein